MDFIKGRNCLFFLIFYTYQPYKKRNVFALYKCLAMYDFLGKDMENRKYKESITFFLVC